MLSIIESPNQYVGAVYSRNPIVFRFLTGYNVTGIKPKIRITFSSNVVVINKNVTFTYNGNTLSFTTVSGPGTPDDSGTQIAANPTGVFTMAQYLLIFIANLMNNYYFATELEIVATGVDWIEFSTIDYSDNFDITTDIPTASVSTITVGVLPATQANYKVLVDVLVSQQIGFGTTEKMIGQIELPSYATPYQREATARIDQIIDAYLNYPNPGNVPTYMHENVCNFRIRYAEKYGTPATVKRIYYSQVYSACKGGYTVGQLVSSPATHHPLNYVGQNPAVEQQLAALLPSPKITTPSAREFISYYNPAVGVGSFSGLTLNYTVTYYAAPGVLATFPFTYTEPSLSKTVTIIGLTTEEISFYVGIDVANIVAWNVNVENYTAATTTNTQYYIVEHCAYADRTMHIANRWGGIDSLPLKGAATHTLRTAAETGQWIPAEYDSFGNYIGNIPALQNMQQGTTRVSVRNSNDNYRVSTGLVPENHIEWIKDCLRMEKTWIGLSEEEAIELKLEVFPFYLPVQVISDSIQIKRELDDLYNITFDYRVLYDETV